MDRRKSCFSYYTQYFDTTPYWSSISIQIDFIFYGQPIKHTHPHLIDGEDLTPGISQKEQLQTVSFSLITRYEDRQLFLLSNLPVGSSVIVGSSSQKYQSWSIPFPYKQNSSFYYLSGINQPNFLLVLQKLQRNTVHRCLFMKNKPEYAL